MTRLLKLETRLLLGKARGNGGIDVVGPKSASLGNGTTRRKLKEPCRDFRAKKGNVTWREKTLGRKKLGKGNPGGALSYLGVVGLGSPLNLPKDGNRPDRPGGYMGILGTSGMPYQEVQKRGVGKSF